MKRYSNLEILYESLRKESNAGTPPAADLLNNPNEQALVDALEIKIAAGKWNLYNKAPELSRILSKLKIKIVNSQDENVQTMAVDNFGNIYINPAFSEKLSDQEFYGVFAHEAMHIANGTFLRRGDRDFTLWNIATDAVMNWALTYDGFALPKEGIVPDRSSGEFNFKDIGEKIKVLDEKGQPLAAEEVYSQLNKIKEKLKKQAQKGDLKKDDKGKGDSGKCDSGQCPPGQGKPGKGTGQGAPAQGSPGPSKPGKPGMSGTPGAKPQDAQKDAKAAEKAAEDYFEKLDNKTDSHLSNEKAKEVNKDVEAELTPEDLKRIEQERRSDITRGLTTKSQVNRGTGVGGIRQLIQKSIPVYVDWKGVVRRYLKAASAKTTTWLKPSMRGLAGGYQAPGKSTSPNKLEAVFAIDTSGSVGTEELNEAFGYIRDIAKTVSNINVRILLWHSSAYYISPPITNKGALEQTISNLTTVSGGTTISSIDPYLAAKKIKPYVVIYMTDGYVEANPRFGSYQKLFVIINNQANNENVKQAIEDLFKKHGQVVITQSLKES